ncbi:Starch-binding associating with outer membrane [Pedobacter steynii]|uniref:Starch-binding associating with outer membrane n=1 Tax=Pedobacter steynii TaxID=430522 RepID=A0A1G9UMW9_9SPHI|nr:RagB/SusD family nutrient uptake outer membrane protein [Pedobacter steynii]NQX40818.1 RagB/SusD family nutrient uptake outer membrane protein [Pedobacter steynii]SDM61256.1 Starch-binding associating with outer membrane [Pedobacter steynii]
MTRTYSIKMIWLLPALLLLIAGCRKNLDQTPQTTLSDDGFWKTTSDLGQAANYLYTFLPGFTGDLSGNPTPYQDNYSDDAYGTGSQGIGDGARIAPASAGEWTNAYRLIRAANNLIEKAPGVTGDAATINRFIAEARFFRAHAYFELVKRYGDVPYLDRTIANADDQALYTPRTARQTVINHIYADLDFVAANCPAADVQPAADYGRITRSAALAYKSRVALFAGTWDKYRSLPTATSNLQIAYDASKLVITESKHSLYYAPGADAADSYYYEFQYNGGAAGNPITNTFGPQVNYTYATNKENILVKNYGQNASNNIISHGYLRLAEQGTIAPTKALVDAYPMKDGTPYVPIASPASSLEEYQNRDPRMRQTIFNKSLPYPSITGIVTYLPAISYRMRKYFTFGDWFRQQSYVNYNVIRYSEVLLNYAEAAYELNVIAPADIDNTINKIRRRATGNVNGDPTILAELPNTTAGPALLAAIRNERRIELAFEGFRYWDLLRWKTAETVLPQAILSRKYIASENPSGTVPPRDPNGFVVAQASANRKFNLSRDYLWPIPTAQVALSNGTLVQNPNW